MAHYLVTSKLRKKSFEKLKKELKEKAFLPLNPFGRSLTYSLENARKRKDGYIIWEEEDYCTPPLKEERAVVLDDYFEDIRVEKVTPGEGWAQISDLPKLFPEFESD
ncbi:MAG: hypothetical protein ACOCWA_06435 [Bacteroidota bacterium]